MEKEIEDIIERFDALHDFDKQKVLTMLLDRAPRTVLSSAIAKVSYHTDKIIFND